MKLRQSTSSSEQDPAGHGDGSARPAAAGAGKQPMKARRRKGSGTWSFIPTPRTGEKALEQPGSIFGGVSWENRVSHGALASMRCQPAKTMTTPRLVSEEDITCFIIF